MQETSQELEVIVEENTTMTFGSIFKSMIPTIMVGTAVAAGCQEVASEVTSNHKIITLAGLLGQYVGGFATYIPTHFYFNKDRLTDEKGSVKWKQFGQDIGAILTSDQAGNKVWIASYGISNEVLLKNSVMPALAGTISGIVSGLIYTTFTAYAAPRVSKVFEYIKNLYSNSSNTLSDS